MMSVTDKKLSFLTFTLSLIVHSVFAILFAFITFRGEIHTPMKDREAFVAFYEVSQPFQESEEDNQSAVVPPKKEIPIAVSAVTDREEKDMKLPVSDEMKETGERLTVAVDTSIHPDYAAQLRKLLSQPETPGPIADLLKGEGPPPAGKQDPEELLMPREGRFPPLPPVKPGDRGPGERTSTAERMEDQIRDVRREIMRDREPAPLTTIPLIVANVLYQAFAKNKAGQEKEQKQVPANQLWYVSEVELRIFIVLWSNTQFRLDRVSQQERFFLGMSENQMVSYLEYMKKRGFVSPYSVSGRSYYRPHVTRREVIDVLMARFTITNNSTEKKILTEYIALLKQCYNYSRGRVVINNN